MHDSPSQGAITQKELIKKVNDLGYGVIFNGDGTINTFYKTVI